MIRYLFYNSFDFDGKLDVLLHGERLKTQAT